MLTLIRRKTSLYVFSILLLCFYAFPGSVKANSNSGDKVFYLNDNQSITGTLFGEEESIYPGKQLKREFYIANNKSFDCYLKTIDISGKLYAKGNRLLSVNDSEYVNYVSNARIRFLCEDNVIFSGTIEDFLDDNFRINYYTEIRRSRRRKFTIEYLFDIDADNSTMELRHEFDITFRFYQIIEDEDDDDDDDSGGGNNGGGNNGGNNGGGNNGGNNGGNTGGNGGNNGGNTGGNTGGNGGSNGGGTGNTSGNTGGNTGGSSGNNNGGTGSNNGGIGTGGNGGNTGGGNTGGNNGDGSGENGGGTTGNGGSNGGNSGNSGGTPGGNPVDNTGGTATSEEKVDGVTIIKEVDSEAIFIEKKIEGISLVKTGSIIDIRLLLVIGSILCIIGFRILFINTKISKSIIRKNCI